MRILELSFKNLNSLYGRWKIDFTAPEYIENGIFSITGPTGAGKSTILDAMCLALYGRTPRLERVNKTNNEIMSRQTAECFAEVVFETHSGKYRCHWSQSKARKKVDGALQDAQHEIAHADSGEIIESKKSLTANVIQEKTGMDFERFTRSMLLAQGSFSAFLQAKADDRAPILEDITGTGIYSDISMLVHEKNKEEAEKLKILNAGTSEIKIMTDEEEQGIKQNVADKQANEAVLLEEKKKHEVSIKWLEDVDALKKDIEKFNADLAVAEESILKSEPEKEKLIKAEKSSELDGEYKLLCRTRTDLKTDAVSLEVYEKKIPLIKAEVLEKEENLKKTEESLKKAKEKRKILAPVIQKTRDLDVKISENEKQLFESKKELVSINEKKAENNEALKKKNKELANIVTDIKDSEEYLSNNKSDHILVSEFTGIKGLIDNISDLYKENRSKNQELESINKKQKNILNEMQECLNKINEIKERDAKNKKDKADKVVERETILDGRLLREYAEKKETLLRERSFIEIIANFEAERNKLSDGTECPLCGSKEHPFAVGNVPEMDETDKKIEIINNIIKNVEKIEQKIKDFDEKEKDLRNKLNRLDIDLSKIQNEDKNLKEKIELINESLEDNKSKLESINIKVLSALKPLNIFEITQNNLNDVTASLKKRLEDWKVNLEKTNNAKELIDKINSEIRVLNSTSKNYDESSFNITDKIYKYESEGKRLKDERFALFEDKKADDEERRINEYIDEKETEEKRYKSALDEVVKKFNDQMNKVDSLTESIIKRKKELEILESEFAFKINSYGFSDEKNYLSNVLSLDERNNIRAAIKKIEDEKAEIFTTLNDRKGRLDVELAKNLTSNPLEEHKILLDNLEKKLQEIKEQIGGLKQILTENSIAKERFREKKNQIESQEKECWRWANLHALIGSADGKKFRNFAQGITFEIMVSNANKQLGKMSNRYLLVRDKSEPLELNVIDNFQAGEVRSTKNLSGGESFIVSLSLALGLSKMSSQKVRVDSLFLDEGFGTLDEEALDIALEALGGLHQEGKLIGVISHVSALKERIGTQISIEPASGGRSIIKGSGCSLATL